ncbi:hypothetical protein QYE76_058420 [Lolium multiflorum]|uniref:Protein kinase domain-containing protein n=1 Tax=Lolium multiflorum TaxID=4521 RepID=A0AAD8T5F1_LOLMU|nr:hypothetical protein QYE76_058420 [Lolium multiflorum]
MPPVPAQLFLLLLLRASSAFAGSFTCVKPSTCQAAIGYVVHPATTYEILLSRFRPITLHELLAANKLPCDTDPKQAVPAKTTLRIPFRCRCTGNGVGESDIYTVQMATGDGNLEIIAATNILAADYDAAGKKQKLPCSCDKVDGSDVMHFAHIVRSGDHAMEIAANYGIPESTLLRTNNITNHTSLRRGQILDIPLIQGTVIWSRVHCLSGYSRRNLVVKPPEGFNKGSLEDISKGFTEGPFTNNHGLGIFVGVIVALLCVALLLSLIYGTCSYWKSAVKSLSSGTTNRVMQFNYSGLARATHKFSEESKIGQGAYGAVYKGIYEDQEVAVKKMKEAKGNTEDFHNELQAISNTDHKNLVRLKGWCGKTRLIDGTSCWKRIKVELLLVFELIPNGSLEDHLYKREQVLPWEKRYEIVKGVGSAIRYLHHKCNPCILHRDIKPGNILLDDHFNAKLADFGLSLITSKKRATAVAYSEGANGYMDPQLKKFGVLMEHNRKSDVYSFGILLLEIACIIAVDAIGKSKGENPERKSREDIWELYNRSPEPQVEAAADPKLRGVFDRKQMERVVVLGLACSQLEETQRPSMEDAMKFLEDGQDLPATTQGEVGYSAPCSVNGEDEAPMIPHGAGSSC